MAPLMAFNTLGRTAKNLNPPALGWVIFGGLGFSTIFTLFLTPVTFLWLAGFSKPRATEAALLDTELQAAQKAAGR